MNSVSVGMGFGMNMKTIMAAIATLLLVGCVSGPKVDNTPVAALDLNRYLGEWINVVNSGLKDGKPKKAIGKGKRTDEPALLRVSFFGPFYADYRVMMIDENYTYALVGSGGADYLWILSRTPTLADDAKSALLAEARRRGYDTDKLIWVKHDF